MIKNKETKRIFSILHKSSPDAPKKQKKIDFPEKYYKRIRHMALFTVIRYEAQNISVIR